MGATKQRKFFRLAKGQRTGITVCNAQAKLSLSCLVLVAFASTASPQQNSGSLIVLMFTKNAAVMAADSRRTVWPSLDHYEDMCKISAPDGKFVFGAAGLESRTNIPALLGQQDFNTVEAARQAERRFSSITPLPLMLVASDWADRMKTVLGSIKPETLKASLQAMNATDTLVCSLFVGKDSIGEISVIQAQIKYDPTQGLSGIRSEMKMFWPDHGDNTLTCGHADIVAEYVAGHSERAMHELKEWKSYTGDVQARIVIRLVDLTIALQPPLTVQSKSVHDVGGNIDAIEFNKSEGIRWLQRKEACPKE